MAKKNLILNFTPQVSGYVGTYMYMYIVYMTLYLVYAVFINNYYYIENTKPIFFVPWPMDQ